MDATAEGTCNDLGPMSKQRKNRRIENKWGAKYLMAMMNAVCTTQVPAYNPPEPPPFVKEYFPDANKLYACGQCNDRFLFQSSFEDHIVRRSWILGYWCQQCILTTCTHTSIKNALCTICIKVDWNKRQYFKNRGLGSGQRCGAIRIFYNQCQFFAHLKSHNIKSVDVADIMLMPFPANIENEWSPQLEIACEAMMEHTFIFKIHIMDWLKHKKIDNYWWKYADNKTETLNNPLSKVINGYMGHVLLKPLTMPKAEEIPITSSKFNNKRMSFDIKIVDSHEKTPKKTRLSRSETTTSSPAKDVFENEDNPCTVNDIAFVDCGPTSNCFEPEFPAHSISKKSPVFVKSNLDYPNNNQPTNYVKTYNRSKKHKKLLSSCASSDLGVSYGNTTITRKIGPKGSLPPADTQSAKSTKRLHIQGQSPTMITESNMLVDVDAKSIESLPNIHSDALSNTTKSQSFQNKSDKSKQNVHTLTVNANQKGLTFQDLSKIIYQLPPHLVNSKRIVFIGQDPEATTVFRKQESSKAEVEFVPEPNVPSGNGRKAFQSKIVPLNKSGNLTKEKNKVIQQNGQQYIGLPSIRNSPSLGEKSTNSATSTKDGQCAKNSSLENHVPSLIPFNASGLDGMKISEKVAAIQNDISSLTPSPSPSEMSSSSSCDIQSKQPSTTATKNLAKADPKMKRLIMETTEAIANALNNESTFESLTFHKGEDENLYLSVKYCKRKGVHTISDTCTMIAKCKQDMLNEFFLLSRAELKKRYDHLQHVHDEILQINAVQSSNVLEDKSLKTIVLQHVLKQCMDNRDDKSEDPSENDVPLNDWESRYESVKEKPTCEMCRKITKPKWYIPGFSRLAKKEIYCSCYRNVCYKCDMYQDSTMRFTAHLNLHDKERPFQCPDCFRNFTLFSSLDIHVWTLCYHKLKRRSLGCKICSINGFQDMESITRHFAVMHSQSKIACDKCHLVLPSYTEYQKHSKDVHSVMDAHEPIRLVLCKLGRCIVRWENYMSHMEKHLVVLKMIWFQCPFCLFNSLEAKPVMYHLQNEHLQSLPELMNPETLLDILPMEQSKHLLKNRNVHLNTESTHTKVNSTKNCVDSTVLPKIVNTRTITSEVFERGSQEAEDVLMAKIVPLESDKTGDAAVFETDAMTASPKILDVRSIADTISQNAKSSNEVTTRIPATKEGNESAEKANKVAEVRFKGSKRSRMSDATETPEDADSLRQHFLLDFSDYSINVTKKILLKDKDKKEKLPVENKLFRVVDLGPGNSSNPLKPLPPLARIPQHLLDLNKLEKSGLHSRKRFLERGQSRALRRIALNGSPRNKVCNFSCHLCREIVNTSYADLSAHFKKKHSKEYTLSVVSPKLWRMSPEFINGGYKDLIGSRKRKLDGLPPNSKRKRRWTPKKHAEPKITNSTGLGLCVRRVTAEDGEGNFMCKKCNQRCADMADLREHIASNHRIKGRYLICLECGENFVVAPSLQMHLKAFHGIEDPITYMSQNTLYAPDSVDEFEIEGKPIEANQCPVCMAVFENKAAVDKHLRVHGMAFLNRKRIEARNALKSPEKRKEPDEEGQVVPLNDSRVEPGRRDNPAETILEKINASM